MGARRLPSGNWRVQARRVIDGKHERKSFTAANKKDAMIAAAAWQEEAEQASALPLASAVRKYIETRDGIMSPATVRGYLAIWRMLCNDPIGSIPVNAIRQDDIDDAIRRWSGSATPKTIRNRHGLLSSALRMFRPGFTLESSIPEKIARDLYVPTDQDVKELLREVKGTALELPVILAAFAGMRRSEITALDRSDIDGGTIHIRRAHALTDSNELVTKAPKTTAGTRHVPLPDRAAPLLPSSGSVCGLTPTALSTAFFRIMKRRAKDHSGPVFRFHDLRHYCASRLHALGIPDAYIMQWLGWGSDNVLKTIYRHALPDEERRYADRIKAYFGDDF